MVQRQFGAIPSQVREQLASLERIVKTLLQQACQVQIFFSLLSAIVLQTNTDSDAMGVILSVMLFIPGEGGIPWGV